MNWWTRWRALRRKDELAKVVADLQAWLRESESKLEESEQRVSKKREANKEFEEELLVYKKEAIEQHEKGFHKIIRQAKIFAKDLDLGFFDPFKDVKDSELLDKEEIDAIMKEDVGEDQGDGTIV